MNSRRLQAILILFLGIGLLKLSIPAVADAATFDEKDAFNYLQAQCALGPRPVGTKAHDTCRDYLAKELKLYADSVAMQDFDFKRGEQAYKLTNIIGKFGKVDAPGILLCAHWDTRPTADEEPCISDRSKPILGADDGASGVAILLQLAKQFHKQKPSVPVTVVFLDGEDFGPGLSDMLLGARYFASKTDKKLWKYGILLDMVGKKNLKLYREQFSNASAKAVVDKIWNKAADLGYAGIFKNTAKYPIEDDHIPILAAGIPCVDIIDIDYPYWHTLKDTPDKCSATSLGIVGNTIMQVVYSERQ